MESAPVPGNEKGLVFNIQRFSLHDGPGIRTTVFMKGCPLRCLWCSNPESQESSPSLMIRDILCQGCGACAEACQKGAISFNVQGSRIVDREKCDRCLVCVEACLYRSLNICGHYMGVEEVVNEVMRDKAFYKNSGGGVTVSGGEPFEQADFIVPLLKACKDMGLHTAADTSGYTSWPKIKKALPFVDLFLWDIKHLEPREHERATGVGNALILENLAKVSKEKTIWLRMPLITGFNDSEDHVRSVAALGQRIGAEKISLLPYHEGGRSKNEQIGRPYPFTDAEAPDERRIDILVNIFKDHGLKVTIGN